MQQLSPQQIESIVAIQVRITPRSEAFVYGLRAGLVLRYNNETNTVCPWRPGCPEYDAYCHGRDAGESYWRVDQAFELERAA